MPTQTIYMIRHAEKPNGIGPAGIDESGNPDGESLTPRGWQRAGAWTELFAPSLADSVLTTPTSLFASNPGGEGKQ